MSRSPRRTFRTVLAAVVATCAVLTVAPFVEVAAAATPTFARTLVGPSDAVMYPSGLEWDHNMQRLVIADTAGDGIFIYSATGTQLAHFGDHGTGPGQFASPRDVAVDDASNIYVGDAENNRVQVFDPNGNYLRQWGGIGTGNGTLNTPIGLTWDSANQVLLVASTGQSLIKAFGADGTFKWKSPTSATTELNAPRDVARGPDGRVWVTDYADHQVRAFNVTPAGVWTTPAAIVLGDDLPAADGPGQFNFPYNMDWSPDGHTMYVSDTGNGRISRYDVSGATPVFVDQIGHRCIEHPQPCQDPPAETGQFNHLRRVVVDDVGNIYGADFWGNGVEVFNPDGTPLRSIEGASAPLPGVSEAYGVDAAPDGSTYVMDRNNHRIERFDAAGALVKSAGARGAQPGTFSWPEALAVAPNGSVWVADTRNDRIQRWPADLAITPNVPSWGSTGTAAGQFNYIEDLTVAPDGKVWIADTRNDRLQVFDPTTNTFVAVVGSSGTAAGQFDDPMGVAVTADAVYVADTFNNRVQKLSLTGTPIASFGGLNKPEGVGVAPDGTVWVADTANNRIVHLSSALADLGDTFGSAGTGDTQFNLPHTVSATATTLYVADTYNDRVQAFTIATTPPPPDTTPPTGSLTSPAAGASVTSPVTFTGTASDNKGVTAVGVAIKDTTNNQWLKANGTWGTSFQYLPATVANPGATTTAWSYTFTTSLARKWGFQAQAVDAAGNTTAIRSFMNFTTTAAAPDTQAPTGALTAPAPNATVTSPVAITGTAADNVGVHTVEVGIQDSVTKQWLRPNGTWGAFTWVPATMASPDSPSTGWSFAFSAPAPKKYGVQVRAADAAGNTATIRSFVNFTVAAGDTTAPTGTLTTPAANATVASPVAMAGTAADNVGVATVDVSIQDPTTSAWLQANGTFAANQAWLPATVANPATASTGWSFTFTAPAAQAWKVSVRAADAAGNSATVVTARTFTTTAPSGTLNPTYQSQIGAAGGVAPLYPAGGASDAAGNLYIADSGGSRLVKIDAAGNQTAFSTTGWDDPRDVDLLPDGTMWVADTSDSQLVKVAADGTVLTELGGPTVFQTPYGVAADATGLWAADTYNNRIVRVDPVTGDILWEKGAPNGTCTATAFSRPRDVSLGDDGKLYVADTDRNRIVVLEPTTGDCIRAFGTQGGGNGQFRSPRSVTGDGTGGIWVADAFNYRIQHLSATGAFLGATNGGYGTGTGQYRSAHCVFVDAAGRVNVCDTFGYRIQRYTVTAQGAPVYDSVLGGTAPADGAFNGPFGLTYGPDGSMYVADWFNHRIEKFSPSGQFVSAFGGYGSQDGSLIFPRAVTMSLDGTQLVVTDSENNRIDIFTTAGQFVKSVKPLTGTALSRPHQTALAADGTYWVVDTNNNRVVHLDGAGTVLHSWGSSATLGSPQGIAVDADGNLYVSNSNKGKIEKYSPTGTLLTTLATSGATAGKVKAPAGLLLTGTGAAARLWVADAGNNRVQVLTLAGAPVASFGAAGSGPGQLTTPKGVAIDPTDGQIAVSDYGNNRISLWSGQ